MAGTLITPSPAAGLDGPAGSKMTPSALNSYRITAAAEGLALHVRTPPKNDMFEFCNLCLSLARGIDYAVANNEAPDRVQDLPILLKQVCQCKNDSLLQAAIMVMMISVKNACKSGWFPTKDSEDLLTLAEEIGSSFCTLRDLNTEASNSHPIISTIMSRFYPQMKMGQILAFLEAKPGYGTFVVDFQISKNAKPSAEYKIRLFVAQTDKIETPSCIVSPQQVNFLLNGKGVERRTNVFMDAAPQLPTVVTQMLKFGTNLLQAVGQFYGNYIIVVAYMSMSSSADRSALLDYVQPAVAALDSDTEITEGPSRISLNCPISFRRIKTPVKGHSCKHLQCFDFDNYVDINSRRPSWRCPHCNQCVCYADIRIDQNMVKILEEVGENVVDVIISADGSWKAALENNDNTDQPHDTTTNCQQDGLVQQKASSVSNIPPDIMDLTDGDDEMDVIHIDDLQDEKPDLANLQSQSNMNDTGVVNQNAASIEDDFWSGILLSTYGPGVSNARLDARLLGGASGSDPTNSMLSPVLTDAISPALDREPEAFRETSLIAASIPQSQISVPSNLSLLQSQFGNSISSNEYGRVPSIARQINRTLIAVQALPAQNLTSVPQQRSRNSFNTSTPQGPSLASQTSALTSLADGYNTASLQIGRQQQYCRPHLSNPHQISQMAPPSLPQHQAPLNWNNQNRSLGSSQAAQQIVGLPAPSQLPNAYKPSTVPITELQNSRQQSLNLRVPHVMSQSPTLARSSAQPPPHFPRNQIPQSGAVQTAVPGSSQRLMGSAQRTAQISRQHQTVPVSLQTTRAPSPSFLANASGFGASGGNTGGTLQSSTAGADGLADLPGEQDWRPTRRMRGSLSGQAYSAALNQLIIQPTPPVQAVARPPLNLTSILPLPGIPAPLHVLMANRDAHAAPRVVNYPSTESTSMAGSPSALPDLSSGMH